MEAPGTLWTVPLLLTAGWQGLLAMLSVRDDSLLPVSPGPPTPLCLFMWKGSASIP